MLGPFAIDMYLPAFHAIALEFAVSQIAVQQTLSTYLFAYAFVMLWHGALSDALGRRPVVLVSLAIYAFASLSCAIAGNIQSLWLLTLPGFNVHQDFDNVLMNGERDGQGNGTESEIYGRVQAGGITV